HRSRAPFAISGSSRARIASGQAVERLGKTVERDRNSNPVIGRLKDDEGRRRAGFQLADQLLVHLDLAEAAAAEAMRERHVADINLIDLEAKPGRQEDEGR